MAIQQASESKIDEKETIRAVEGLLYQAVKKICIGKVYVGKCPICQGMGETIQFAENCPLCKGQMGQTITIPLLQAVSIKPDWFAIAEAAH